MAVYTTAQSGNTNAGATWVGGSVPPIDGVTGAIAYGHQIVIANAHTLTNPAGVKFWPGTSPSTDDHTVPAMAGSSAAGTGIFVNNGWFRHRGPVNLPTGTWTFGPSSTLEHDSSGAPTPATTHYSWHVGMNGDVGKVAFNGAAGSRVTVGIAAGSGAAGGFQPGPENGYFRNGQVAATYTSFADWGTSTLYFCNANLNIAGDSLTFDNCLFDRCGFVSAAVVANGTNHRLKNSSVRSPVDQFDRGWGTDTNGSGYSANPTTGDRRVEHAYCEGSLVALTFPVAAQSGLHVVDSVCAGATSANGAPLASGGFAPTVAEWNNVLVYNRAGGDAGCGSFFGALTRSVLLRAAPNTHFIDTINHAVTYDGWIAEAEGNILSVGDVFQTATNTTGTVTVGIKHGLALPCPDGKACGVVANHSDSTLIDGSTHFGPQITTEHNTYFTDDGGTGLCLGVGGENSTGAAGLHAHTRANLVLRSTPGVGFICKWIDAQVASLVAGTFADADYNGYYNISPATTKDRYYRQDTNPGQYTGTPGTHDVATGNPNFVDSSRRFLSWAQSIDPTITSWSDALNRFSKMNDDTGSIAGLTVSACYDWIRAGWVPTSAAINTSYPADTEQFLGFAQAVAAGPTAQQKLFYRRLQYAASIAALLLSHALSFFGARHV